VPPHFFLIFARFYKVFFLEWCYMVVHEHAKLFIGFVFILFIVGLALGGDLDFSNDNTAGDAIRSSLNDYADPYDPNYESQYDKSSFSLDDEKLEIDHDDGNTVAPLLPDIRKEAEGIMLKSKTSQQKTDDDCFVLTQENFQQGFELLQTNQGSIFLMNTCLELAEDIELYVSTIKLLNGYGQQSQLKCNGHTITADVDLYDQILPVLWLTGESKVENCVVETINGRANVGIVSEDTSLLENIDWYGSSPVAVYLQDDARAFNVIARDYSATGFYLEDNAEAIYSHAFGHGYNGFTLIDTSSVSYSQSSGNTVDGYDFFDDSTGNNLLAYDNWHGFHSNGIRVLQNVFAIDNNRGGSSGHVGITGNVDLIESESYEQRIGLRLSVGSVLNDVISCNNFEYDFYGSTWLPYEGELLQADTILEGVELNVDQLLSCEDIVDSGCVPINLALLDTGETYVVNSGCVELWSDVSLQEEQSIILQNDAELYCNDFIIYGDSIEESISLVLEDDAQVHDCIVENSYIAYDMYDSSEAYTSIARENNVGFGSRGNDVEIFDSESYSNTVGFSVGSSRAFTLTDTVSENNELGGRFLAGASVYGSNANFCGNNEVQDIQVVCGMNNCPDVAGTVYAETVSGEDNGISNCPLQFEEVPGEVNILQTE
jgi:hypothetical protein